MSGPDRTESFEQVRERVRDASDIVEIVGQYVELRKAGRTWKGLCPFHSEKTPSFTVSPERRTYHCFGCGEGGDVFGFVGELEKLSFSEALRWLADRAGIELPRMRAESGGNERLYAVLEEAAELYRRFLRDESTGRRARDLLRRRGIQREVEDRFGLGYAPDGWDGLSSRLLRRHGEAILTAAGLAIERRNGSGVYDRFRDRLLVPFRHPGGRTLGFGGRVLGEEEPKYLNSPESAVYHKGQFVFGLPEAREALRESGEAVLVEGYFDVLALHQTGFPSAVAVAGTALTSEQARLLARYVDRVVLALDGDAAGRKASERSLAPLVNAGMRVRVLVLPVGEDPDSYATKHGADAWRRAVDRAVSPATFLCRELSAPGEDVGGALERVLSLAAAIEDLPPREALLADADRQLAVGLDRMRSALEGGRSGGRVRIREDAAAEPSAVVEPVPYLEQSLIALVCASVEAAEQGRKILREEMLGHPWTRATWAQVRRAPAAGPAAWMAELETDARHWLSAVAGESVAPPEPIRALEDHLRRLESRRLVAERETVQRQLAGAGSPAEMAKHMNRLQEIAARMSELTKGAVLLKGETE